MPADPENPGLERVKHELRAEGIKDQTRNPKRSGVHTRGYLPHVKREGASYFVTFRLADALPREVLLRFEARRAERLRALEVALREKLTCADSAEAVERDFRRDVERYLDRGAGQCNLRRPEIATLMAGALAFFHTQRYLLHEWVVMPNHVHAIVWPMPNHLLGDVLKSWKQFVSLRAKRMLALGPEPFWQPESYDHWIRDDDERASIARYIRMNPVKAGLCKVPGDWRWSSSWRGDGTVL